MSRNLSRTDCYYCNGKVCLDEEARVMRDTEHGRYDDYAGMIVADATCTICRAQYLAWIDERQTGFARQYPSHVRWVGQWGEDGQRPFYDLSFRSTFNDEPGMADLPLWNWETGEPYDYLADGYWNTDARVAEIVRYNEKWPGFDRERFIRQTREAAEAYLERRNGACPADYVSMLAAAKEACDLAPNPYLRWALRELEKRGAR